MNYPLTKDQWEDAGMGEVFDYIYQYKDLQIPDDWLQAMKHFKDTYFLCRVARIKPRFSFRLAEVEQHLQQDASEQDSSELHMAD